MNFPRPKVHTIDTVTEAKAAGCDCVMLKYPGMEVAVNCTGQACELYCDLGLTTHQENFEAAFREPFSALLVGAKAPGYPIVALYDVWWVEGTSVAAEAYRARYTLVRTLIKKLDERFILAQVAPIQAVEEMWRVVVRDAMSGLVFRRSRDTSAGDVYIIRAYPDAPTELKL